MTGGGTGGAYYIMAILLPAAFPPPPTFVLFQTEICFCNEILKTDRRQEEVKFPEFLPDICVRGRELELILAMAVVELLSL